jgi:TRAP-type C4-dicarboxylate transport system permease small subunit
MGTTTDRSRQRRARHSEGRPKAITTGGKHVLSRLGRLWDRVLDVMALLSAVAMTCTLLFTFAGVVSRYVFGRAQAWTVEVSEYLLLYMVFLGGAWLLREDGHVRMDLLVQNLQGAKRELLEVLLFVISTALVGVVAYYGVVVTWEAYASGSLHSVSSLRPRVYLLLLPIPVGGVCLFVECLRRVALHVRSFRQARAEGAVVVPERAPAGVVEKETGLF